MESCIGWVLKVEKKSWTNPLISGAVDISCNVTGGWYLLPSSGSGDRTDFNVVFERPSQNTWCSSTTDRLCFVDLKTYQLQPTHVTLACQYSPQTYLCNFGVYGSNDKSTWDNLFTESTARVSQGVPYTWTVPKDKVKKTGYRYFKFESTNSYQILLSGIEMYGTITKWKGK